MHFLLTWPVYSDIRNKYLTLSIPYNSTKNVETSTVIKPCRSNESSEFVFMLCIQTKGRSNYYDKWSTYIRWLICIGFSCILDHTVCLTLLSYKFCSMYATYTSIFLPSTTPPHPHPHPHPSIWNGPKACTKLNICWVELSWVELSWVELNWVEFSWVELNWVELSWVETRTCYTGRCPGEHLTLAHVWQHWQTSGTSLLVQVGTRHFTSEQGRQDSADALATSGVQNAKHKYSTLSLSSLIHPCTLSFRVCLFFWMWVTNITG